MFIIHVKLNFYYYFFNRKLHLHYLHDLRSLLVIFLIIVNICEISQSCLSLHPPDDARYRITSPLSFYSACLYLISTVTVTAFIRIIEVRNKPGKFIICKRITRYQLEWVLVCWWCDELLPLRRNSVNCISAVVCHTTRTYLFQDYLLFSVSDSMLWFIIYWFWKLSNIKRQGYLFNCNSIRNIIVIFIFYEILITFRLNIIYFLCMMDESKIQS